MSPQGQSYNPSKKIQIPYHMFNLEVIYFFFLDFNGLESNCQFDFYPFFCHIFLFKIPNGKYKLIFDIYVLGLSNGISKAHF
jgi:hypothetical protein